MKLERNRLLSIQLFGAAFAVGVFVKFFSGVVLNSCRNAGCVGAGAGTAVLGFGLVFLIMVAATVFAARSYFQTEKPRSILRLIELWFFWLVTFLALLMTLGSFM